MKKYLIPASITAVAVGAFLVFQNAGIVSPTLGTWTTVAKLSKPNGPGSYVGVTEVPKFNISVLDCELRLKYVYETAGIGLMGGGTTPKQLAVGVEYPNRVTRSSLGQWTLQFSNSSGIGPFNTGMTSTPPLHRWLGWAVEFQCNHHHPLNTASRLIRLLMLIRIN